MSLGDSSITEINSLTNTLDQTGFFNKLSSSAQTGYCAAYSTRLLRTEYLGPAVRVRRSTDNVERDFYANYEGDLGTTRYAKGDRLDNWLSNGIGYITTMYDQSKCSRNISQTTANSQPIIITNSSTSYPPVRRGLIGYYNASSWTGTQWTDLSTSGNNATTITGTINTTTENTTSFLWGNTNAGLRFPAGILPTNYTLFHVAKYNGANRQRIFDGVTGNWLSGFWNNNAEVAYHETWLTDSGIGITNTTNWVISTDQKNRYRANGRQRGTASGSSNNQISINFGAWTSERSDWAVGEVIVYNRELTITEIEQVEGWLMNKWLPFTFTTSLSRVYPKNFILYSGSEWLELTNTQIPPTAMTSNSTGSYVASASTEFGAGVEAWRAFDLDSSSYWHSATTYNSTTGRYTGSVSTTDINNRIYLGEWLQLQTPTSFRLTSFSITPRTNLSLFRSPRSFVLLGSTNGSSWNLLHEETEYLEWDSAANIKFFNIIREVSSYSYYRIVTRRVGVFNSSTNQDSIQFSLVLNPTSPPIPRTTPLAALTSASSGGYVVLSSSNAETPSWDNWKAFNLSTSGEGWHTSYPVYNVNTGVYTGSASTTVGSAVYTGEWIQLQSPFFTKIDTVDITPRSGLETERAPRDFYLAGSLNGSNWNLLATFTGVTWANANTRSFSFDVYDTLESYNYIRLIVNRIGNLSSGMTNANSLQIIEISYKNSAYSFLTKWVMEPYSSIVVVCEQSSSPGSNNRRACIIRTNLGYGFNGETNDAHDIVRVPVDVERQTVMVCNHNLTTGNVKVYDGGDVNIGTSTNPGALNVGGDVFRIGSKSNNTENFVGAINELIVVNRALQEPDAMLYTTPTDVTTPKKPFPNPIVWLNFHPYNTHTLPNPARFKAQLDSTFLQKLGHLHIVRDWNGYSQATLGNRPTYYKFGGYANHLGYVYFNRTKSEHLNGGSKTFNINTNGGFTAIALIRFTGAAADWERILDFANGAGVDNIYFARNGTSTTINFSMYNGTSGYDINVSNQITQNEWAIFTARYTASTRVAEIFKNGTLVGSTTFGAAITDKTLNNTYIGRSAWPNAYLNADMAGLYIYDSALSLAEMSAVSNLISFSELTQTPQHMFEHTNVFPVGHIISTPSVPRALGYSARFDNTANTYYDYLDMPNVPFSVSFWFNTPSSGYQTMVGLTDSARAGGGFQVDWTGNQITLFVALPNQWSSISTTTLSLNTWYHIAVTINTNFQAQLFLNGAYVNQTTGTGLPPSRTRLIIGSAGDAVRGYAGFISDFRVYDYILRTDEVSDIVGQENGQQRTLYSTQKYLVNKYNWYTEMTLTSVINQTGTDPNVQTQLLQSSTIIDLATIHSRIRIQDYDSFVFSFQLYVDTATADAVWFFCGASDVPTIELSSSTGLNIIFQVWPTNGLTERGIAITRTVNGVEKALAQSYYSQWFNAAQWYTVSIKYNRKTTNTWVINVNGLDVLSYNDLNVESWIASSGNFWGIAARAGGGGSMNAYVRRLDFVYVPRETRLSRIQNIEKQFPEIALTGNSSFNCVASSSTVLNASYPPWRAFDRSGAQESIFASAGGLYNTTTGNYTGSVSTTVGGVAYLGEWIQIQLPNPVRLTKYNVVCRTNFETTQSPNSWILAGSTNATTWNLLDQESSVVNWSTNNRIQTFGVQDSGAYNYFRMICTVMGQTITSIKDLFILGDLQLFGYPITGVKYPIEKMTSNTTVFNGNAIGAGTYVASSSSVWEFGGFDQWRAFSNETAGDAFHVGSNGGAGFYAGASNTYSGSTTTTISGSSYAGEWLQIELPSPIALTRYGLICRTTLGVQSPKNWKIAGSNDAVTWTEVDSETGITSWSDNVPNIYSTTNQAPYRFFRIVVNATVSDLSWSQREWMLYDDSTSARSVSNVKQLGLIDGLTWKYYGQDLAETPANSGTVFWRNIGTTTDTTTIREGTSGYYPTNWGDQYSVEWTGYFRASVTGTYTFYTESDDWSYLWIGSTALVGFATGNALVNNGGYHPVQERSGTIYLIGGVYYPIRIQWGEGGGGDECKVSFMPPSGTRTYNGSGYYYSSIGTNSAFPAESAQIIKAISHTNTDGVYYINANGVSTATYCLMNDIYDGGGWMLLMKATRGTTFNYDANYWTTTNTLNSTETNRNDGDAKFNVFNYSPIKDVMAIWPDIPSKSYLNPYSKNGGSLILDDGWCWKVDNWNAAARTTALAGFQSSRDALPSNPTRFTGYSDTIFSNQTPAQRHVFGGGTHVGTVNAPIRWGFLFNENSANDFSSSDVSGGIGIKSALWWGTIGYSAGDSFGCCGNQGINRSARIELYGR